VRSSAPVETGTPVDAKLDVASILQENFHGVVSSGGKSIAYVNNVMLEEGRTEAGNPCGLIQAGRKLGGNPDRDSTQSRSEWAIHLAEADGRLRYRHSSLYSR
jgi:hypothetical protein